MTWVVPYSAGGSQDAVARLLAPGLSAALGQQVVVENVGGAGGTLGVLRVAKAPPDGYQFLLGNVGTHAQSQSLYDKPPYDAVADFVPVALLVDQSMVLAVRKDLPAANLRSSSPSQRPTGEDAVRLGGRRLAHPSRLRAAQCCDRRRQATHIPYRGGGPAMQDLMAGRIDYFCYNTASIKPQIDPARSGRWRCSGRAGREPAAMCRRAQEQGLKDFEVSNWMALFLPKNTPAPIVARLHQAAAAALSDGPVQEKLRVLGAEPVTADRMPPDRLPGFVAGEVAKWRTIIKQAGIRLE